MNEYLLGWRLTTEFSFIAAERGKVNFLQWSETRYVKHSSAGLMFKSSWATYNGLNSFFFVCLFVYVCSPVCLWFSFFFFFEGGVMFIFCFHGFVVFCCIGFTFDFWERKKVGWFEIHIIWYLYWNLYTYSLLYTFIKYFSYLNLNIYFVWQFPLW